MCGVLLTTTSCEDNYYSESEPQFEVSLDKEIVRVGERAVFNFEGTADIISVFTGEEGNSYEYKDQKRILPATMWMSFMFKTSSGTVDHPNPAKVPIYYSTDFSGNYTLEDVEAATWIEITDQFTMPTTAAEQVASGDVCINEFFDEKGTIYLAMYYEVQAYNASTQPHGRTQWNFMNFLIEGKTNENSGIIYDGNNAGWQLIYAGGYNPETDATNFLPDVNSSRVLFRSDYKPTVNKKVWCVSAPIVKADDVDLGYDVPVAVKSFSDPTMTSYYHIYNTPGEYTATFLGVNASAYGRYEVVRQATVTVVNDSGSITQPTPEEWK